MPRLVLGVLTSYWAPLTLMYGLSDGYNVVLNVLPPQTEYLAVSHAGGARNNADKDYARWWL